MALDERETVVVEERGDRSSSWIIPLVVLILLILAFFYFGGFGLFGGDTTNNETETINVDTPDNVEVEPSNQTPDTTNDTSTEPSTNPE